MASLIDLDMGFGSPSVPAKAAPAINAAAASRNYVVRPRTGAPSVCENFSQRILLYPVRKGGAIHGLGEGPSKRKF